MPGGPPCTSQFGAVSPTSILSQPSDAATSCRRSDCGWYTRVTHADAPILAIVRRGILGGTFDPPHVAHLIAGEVAYRDLALDVVTFMPAGAPWQKADRRVSDAEHRWMMTRLAVRDIPYFDADDREVRRDGWTFTADTLSEFDEGEELVLILGADTARGIQTWHRWDYVLSRAHLAVAPRPGVQRSEVDVVIPVPFTWLDMPLLLLSGTTIRSRAEAGKTIRFMVAEPVWEYVRDHRVYE